MAKYIKMLRPEPKPGCVSTRQFVEKLFANSDYATKTRNYKALCIYLKLIREEKVIKEAYSSLNTFFYMETELQAHVDSFGNLRSFEFMMFERLKAYTKAYNTKLKAGKR